MRGNQKMRIVRGSDRPKHFIIGDARVIFNSKRNSVRAFRELTLHDCLQLVHLCLRRMRVSADAQFRTKMIVACQNEIVYRAASQFVEYGFED